MLNNLMVLLVFVITTASLLILFLLLKRPPEPQPVASDGRKAKRRQTRFSVRLFIIKRIGDPMVDGWLSDSSTLGIGMIVPDLAWQDVPVGRIWLIKNTDYVGDIWHRVEIRHAQPTPHGWEIGCRFLGMTPPWVKGSLEK